MPSTYDKEKPWDTDDIDKWKVRRSTLFLPRLSRAKDV
jgi:hypothetical protein